MNNPYTHIMARLNFEYMPGSTPAPVDDETVANFEKSIGHPLPPDYRSFIQVYGGTAAAHGSWVALDRKVTGGNREIVEVEVFYGFVAQAGYGLFGVQVALSDRLPRSVIAIASSPGGVICLSLDPSFGSGLYWWNREGAFKAEEWPRVADSFDALLKSLTLQE